MGGNISNLLNLFRDSASEASEKSEDDLGSVSFYIEPSSTHRLFELVKRCGNFRIQVTPLGFQAHLGPRKFTIIDSSEFIELSLHHADVLTQESAEITAELASILLPETDKPIKLQASNIDDERRLFEAVKKFFLKHPLRAFNEAQRMRFEFLEQRQREQALGVGLIKKETGSPGFKVSNLMGGFLKADEFGYKTSSIYVESDTLGFLMELTKEAGEVVIESAREHFRFLLRGHVISIQHYSEFSRIQLISPLDTGGIELLLRIARFIYGDLDEKRLEHQDGLSTSDARTSEPPPRTSPANPYFFSNFLNNPALLDRPENIINPNNTFHSRNIHNPLNPLNPKSLYHPSNPKNPVRLSFEAHREEDERIILKSLEKFSAETFKLDARNEEQKKRFQSYLHSASGPGYSF